MKCLNCQNELADDAKFCNVCGAKVEEQAAPAAEEPAKENVVQSVAAAGSEAVAQAAAAVKKANKGLLKKIIVIALIVVVAILAISGLKSCFGGKTINPKALPLVYSTDDEGKFLMPGKKEGIVVADREDIGGSIQITADGKYIFFGMDPDGSEFDLYYRAVSKKNPEANTQIAKGVSEYQITPDGKTVFYLKNGTLYKCGRNGNNEMKMGKDVVEYTVSSDYKAVVYKNDDGEVIYSTGVDKIHNEIAKKGEFYYGFSENGKKIRLVETKQDEETYDTQYTISLCGTGKNDKAEKLVSGADDYSWADSDYSALYYVKKDNLYYQKGTGEAVEVSGLDNDVVYINWIEDEKENRHFYAVTQKEIKEDEDSYYSDYEYNLYYVDGKKAKLLVEDFGDSYYSGEKVIVTSEYDDDKVKYTSYVRADYDKFVEIEIPEEDDELVTYDYTEDSFYTIEEVDDEGKGELIKYAITKKGIDFSKGTTIAEDVMSVYTTYAEAFNKETVFIKHDSDEYSVYTGGKEATEIDAEVYNFIWANKNGKFYFGADYNSEDDVYSLAKFDGKKVVTIAEDVKRAVIVNDSIIYYINEDDELVLNTGKSGKDTVVDEDVKSLVHPMSYVVVEEDAEADWFSLSMVGNDW